MRVIYLGPLARSRGKTELVKEAEENTLMWAAIAPEPPAAFDRDTRLGDILFYITVQLRSDERTVMECNVKGKKLHVKLSFPEQKKKASIDDPVFPFHPRRACARITARELIQRLSKEG
jgi:hypothetical protein